MTSMLSAMQTRRFMIAEYHHLIELGFLQDDERIEWIRGELIKMAAKGVGHETCLRRLLRRLPVLIQNRATL